NLLGKSRMFGRVVSSIALLGLSLATARAEEEIIITGRNPPKDVFVNPVVPEIASETRKEGWVHLQLSLSPTGQVTNAKVIQSFPKLKSSVQKPKEGYFDK